MSGFRRYDIIAHSSPFLFPETSIFTPESRIINHHFPPWIQDDEFNYALEILSPTTTPSLFDFASPFDSVFDTVTSLVQIRTTPFCSSYQRLQQRRSSEIRTELYLQSLSDRVDALESKFERLVMGKLSEFNRKYTWTAEIKDGVDRKYKWTTEIKGEQKAEKKVKHGKGVGGGERNLKWTAEITGKNDKRACTWKATVGGDNGESRELSREWKAKKGEKGGSSGTRIVEIEEPFDAGAVLLRQAFAKRAQGANIKGKKKMLSPQDAAMIIQMSFRDYLIRRSRALRALRDLAVAKTKLKEIRALFHNFSYRNRVASDAEERQKFSEKIIVLLLTVDAIEGADLMVRAAKRSMVDELEAMLDVVDPQPQRAGKSLSMRRTFDMPTGVIQEEIAEGVAQVVQMLDES
ncbi:hypothetical protein Nepgr_010631 [Nepenthes gracilis]|uniref:BAG domain-containing protein n=1 Tax=Nepenthes gracilis TaxID=150966 RepID=A0AAD3XLL4_NEPGR|nr:hypothetical protein Nepgr_010631 [Nepenthes gracilis]